MFGRTKEAVLEAARSLVRPANRFAINRYVRNMGLFPSRQLSKSGISWNIPGERFVVPNHSTYYHGILRQWWEHYGLGARCLLVSELTRTKEFFSASYPSTCFTTTDYFVEISTDGQTCDHVWELGTSPPADLVRSRFASVLCQATLEHVRDPMGALRELAAMLDENGMMFVHTHTPGFVYHAFPRDYFRFWPDWFEDLPQSIPTLELQELVSYSGHIFAALRRMPRR